MSATLSTIVLGSRSPQRLELLRHIVPSQRIRVVPPRSADEPGFHDLDNLAAIHAHLRQIARAKCDDVLAQVRSSETDVAPDDVAAVVTADTTIIAFDASARPVVLGQPPDDDTYVPTLRHWFREFYAGKHHLAATALCVETPAGRTVERLVQTQVTFTEDVDRWLEWYLATDEPRGKAGGYAIQGAGSVFVERVEGSWSNVVGLPLRELMDALVELSIHVG